MKGSHLNIIKSVFFLSFLNLFSLFKFCAESCCQIVKLLGKKDKLMTGHEKEEEEEEENNTVEKEAGVSGDGCRVVETNGEG